MKTTTQYLEDFGAGLMQIVATDRGGYELGVDAAMDQAVAILQVSKVIHLIGNGGTAAIMAHVHNDLLKACKRKALVYQDVPLLTAVVNDTSYEYSYQLPMSVWLGSTDVLIAASSSGQSPNILQATTLAIIREARIITLSGFRVDNPLRQRGEVNFYVPSSDYGSVELGHSVLLHYLTDRLHAG